MQAALWNSVPVELAVCCFSLLDQAFPQAPVVLDPKVRLLCRDSVPGTSGALTATHVEVITPPPLRPVSVSAARMGVKSSKLTVGNNLKVLVLRPRLPQGCKLGRRVGGGRKKV